VLIVGLTAQNQPIGGGCALLVGQQLAAAFVVTDAAGLARYPLSRRAVHGARCGDGSAAQPTRIGDPDGGSAHHDWRLMRFS